MALVVVPPMSGRLVSPVRCMIVPMLPSFMMVTAERVIGAPSIFRLDRGVLYAMFNGQANLNGTYGHVGVRPLMQTGVKRGNEVAPVH